MKPVYAYGNMRYGLFVHYIATDCCYMDGTRPANLNEAVDRFDLPRFIDEIASMHIEYLIFTAWHFQAVPLYPSKVIEKWRPEKKVSRDLIGELIDAARERGIRVILYTHPRDGHDFVGEERIRCGWGEGIWEGSNDTPNPENFDYSTWNQYTLEMYEELANRYGSRIDGIWLDGMGPGRFVFGIHRSYSYEYPIVDYVAIRKIMKSVNPDLALIQNGYGYQYTADYMMPESFEGFETVHPDVSDWPAGDRAIALCFTSAGWAASGKYGDTQVIIPVDTQIRYTIFQATAASAGGTCWAAGPYCGGGWDVDVLENMQTVGSYMARLGDSVRNIVRSTSWPTNGGDTLRGKNYVFACSSSDRNYEYIHMMKIPENGMIRMPLPEDGAAFAAPCPITPGIRILDFVQNAEGVSFRIEGEADAIDTVIRLKRQNRSDAPVWFWINDSDKRIRFRNSEDWTYNRLKAWEGKELTQYHGCYEDDMRHAYHAGARFDTYFEGSEIELICAVGPDGADVDILIDEICVATVSTRAEEYRTRVPVFRSGELYGGIHTFSVVHKGGGTLNFDALHIRV